MRKKQKHKKERITRYHFPVELIGHGKTPKEAWENALEYFYHNPGTYNKVKKGEVFYI